MPKTRSQTSHYVVQLEWLPVCANKFYAVESIDIPISLFNRAVEKCRDLFANELECLCKSKIDWDSIEFLTPKRSLLIVNAEEVERSLTASTTPINLTRSLATALRGEHNKADCIHVIVTAQKPVVLNWIFLNPEDTNSSIYVDTGPMFQRLFQGPSKDCHAFFAEGVYKLLKKTIDVKTVKLWKPIPPLLIADVGTSKGEEWIDVESFADFIHPAQHLSEELDVKNSRQIHIIILAKEKISLNLIFLNPWNPHSKPIFRSILISQSLFHSPSQHCQDFFAAEFSRIFKTLVDAESIRLSILSQPLLITDLNNFDHRKSSFNLIQPLLPLSTALEGNEKKSTIVHVLVTIEKEDKDIVRPLPEFQRYQQTLTNKGKSPSEAAKATEYVVSQSKQGLIIYDGHSPSWASEDTLAPPIHIFHRVFNNFLYSIEGGPEPTHDDLIDTRKLMNFLRELSNKKEEKRNQIIFDHLEKILRQDLIPGEKTSQQTGPDGTVAVSVDGASIPILIVKLKNELGEGNCDPSIQAGLSMKRCWAVDEVTNIRQRCCCPTLLLTGGGAYLGVLGAVLTDKVIVQRLTGLNWFGISSTEEDRRIRTNARILLALRAALQELTQFYATNVPDTPPLEPDTTHPRYFPYPTTYQYNNQTVRFRYLRALEDDAVCVTFLAEVIGDSPGDINRVRQQIVVKFAARYGKEVHQFLADLGHAPKLYYCGPLPDTPPFPSVPEEIKDAHPGLSLQNTVSMIVMELVDVEASNNLPIRFRPQLEKIITELHGKGFVLGDLRHPNILVDSQGVIKLIDFNWCGRYNAANQDWDLLPALVKENYQEGGSAEGTNCYATYPISISMSDQIPWPTDVGPLRPILPQHDWHMLDRLPWV